MSAVGARDEPGATPYHRTKWHAEELVRASGLSHAVFRPSIINGPESPPIRTLARLHRWSPVVPVFGDGHFPTQPVWVEDVALAFALAVEQPALGGAFELGGPQVLTYEEFVLDRKSTRLNSSHTVISYAVFCLKKKKKKRAKDCRVQ